MSPKTKTALTTLAQQLDLTICQLVGARDRGHGFAVLELKNERYLLFSNKDTYLILERRCFRGSEGFIITEEWRFVLGEWQIESYQRFSDGNFIGSESKASQSQVTKLIKKLNEAKTLHRIWEPL
jgi:hypothetical protein